MENDCVEVACDEAINAITTVGRSLMGGPHTLDASVPWVQINASEKGAEMCSHMEKYGGVCATVLTVTWYLNSAGNDDKSESENECPIQVHYPIAEHVARLLEIMPAAAAITLSLKMKKCKLGRIVLYGVSNIV